MPPHTTVEPLEFEDVKFKIEQFEGLKCEITGEQIAFLDELYGSDGKTTHVVNDSDFMNQIKEKERPIQWVNRYLTEKIEKTFNKN